MAESISQRIALEGAEAVAAAFERIGKAGEDAFKKIDAAAQKSKPGDFVEAQFKPAVDAAEKFGESLGHIIGDIGTVVTRLAEGAAAVAGFAAGFLTFVNLSSRSVDALGKLAEQSGTTIENLSGLTAVFSEFGISTERTTLAFERFATKVQQLWPEIQKATRAAALTIQQDNLAIEQAINRVAQATINFQSIDKAISLQRQQNTFSVRDAVLNLQEAQNRLADIQGRDRPFDTEELARKKAILAVQEARQRVEEARLKAAKDEEEADIKAKDAALQRESAEAQLAVARKKLAEDQANDITRLATFVKNLSEGVVKADEGLNKSATNIVKGLLESFGEAVKGVDQVGTSLGSFANAAPNQLQLILRLADLFHNLSDEGLKVAIATQLFGRAVAQDMVRALNGGSHAILEERDRLRDLGLAFTDADAKAAGAFRRSFGALNDLIGIVTDKIGVTFAPLLTDIINKVRTTIEKNFGSIQAFAERVRDTVTPIITALANSLLGIKAPSFAVGQDNTQTQKIREWQGIFDGFKNSVSTFFFQTLPNGFQKVRDMLDEVADSITRITGLKITGDQLGIALLVGQFTGLNRAILDVGLAVVNLGVLLALLVAINPFVLLLAAAVGLGVALEALINKFPQEALVAAIGVVTAALVALALLNPFTALVVAAVALGVALDALVENWDAITSAIGRAVDKVKEFFTSASNSGAGSEFNQGGFGGFASGGFVRGAGSGTSDSILARLSNGEFVINSAAVRHFGARFFAALNSMQMPALSRGGLIRDAFDIPRFAAGGLAAGMPHLGSVDLRTNHGTFRVFAGADAVETLQRASVIAQVSSTGRSPRWKR